MRHQSKKILAGSLLAAAAALGGMSVVFADGIATDGSVGAAETLTGSHVTIPQALGTTVGTNLFHSFAQFNIQTGQTVTFSENTPNALDNIISRVTGGSRSAIDGVLQSTPAGHADFYLINPAGMVFGQHASVNVPASFHVTTADELRFQDGGLFSATHPEASTLSMEAPEAYGFAGDRSSEIQFLGNGGFDEQYNWHGTQIQLQPDNTLDVAGGSLAIESTQLASSQGTVRLIAQQGAGLVPVQELPKNATGGAIKISDDYIDVSGNGAGLLALRGGLINVDNSQLYADNQGDTNAATGIGVDIQASDLRVADGTSITADSYSKGQAGQMNIAVTDSINLLNGGFIGSTAWSQGNAGSITVHVNQLTIDGQNNGAGTGIFSSTLDLNSNAGDAGQINLNIAGKTNILNGGEISSLTYSPGKAGAVIMQAGQLTIDRQGSDIVTGITSSAQHGSTGNAGQVNLTVANTLTILNGGEINSDTFAQGDAGKVSINASNMIIDGAGKNDFTGIGTSAEIGSTGNAGKINVSVADTLKILNKGEVKNATYGAGDGGTVDVQARHITLDGQGYKDFTGINATAFEGSSGQPGNIRVQASDDIHLSNSARISIRNRTSIEQPDRIHPTLLYVNSPILIMDAKSQITAESFGNIAASNIAVDIADWLNIKNALITTSVSGTNGNGGNINIHSPVMVMDTGFIQANTVAENAQGGRVNIDVNALIPSGGSLIGGGNKLYAFTDGKFGLNVIQAAAPEGLSGTVAISNPQLNLSGVLANLTATQFDTRKLAEDFCATNRGSSLTKLGRGGMLPKTQDTLFTDQ